MTAAHRGMPPGQPLPGGQPDAPGHIPDPTAIRPALESALAVTAPGGDPASAAARPALIEFITREEMELSRPW